jgi:predicted amidophosphoribosyltransferase
MVHISNTSAFENSNNIFMIARYTYIPTTVQANGKAWGIRKKVWRFKDGDIATSSEIAKWVSLTLDESMPDLENCTFVCIPASSEEKTQMRYEQFAQEVCATTQMDNAYNYIKVEGERLAIHEHKVCKSVSKVQVLSFNHQFFNGRKVIIFDDVITKGNSFATMVDYLEGLGAKVIGGIFLAATAIQNNKA